MRGEMSQQLFLGKFDIRQSSSFYSVVENSSSFERILIAANFLVSADVLNSKSRPFGPHP